MKKIILAVLLLGSLAECSSPTPVTLFDRKTWLKSPGIDSQYPDYHGNRQAMMKDLMENHLRLKMSKVDVVTLLGKPYRDGIEKRIPKNTIEPDSVSIAYANTIKYEEDVKRKKYWDDVDKFYDLQGRPDTLMLYQIGVTGGFAMGYKYLAVELSGKGLVKNYWVETH